MPPKTSSTSASLTLLLMQITGCNVKHTKRDKELKIHEWQSKQKQAKQQHFPKQKQHLHIFIPKQSWAVMCPRCSLSQVNCIQYSAAQNRKCSGSTAAFWAISGILSWMIYGILYIIYIYKFYTCMLQGSKCQCCKLLNTNMIYLSLGANTVKGKLIMASPWC